MINKHHSKVCVYQQYKDEREERLLGQRNYSIMSSSLNTIHTHHHIYLEPLSCFQGI